MYRAYKTELNPNNKQRTFFERCAQTRQFVYNIGLREWERQYKQGGKPSAYGLRKQFNAVKAELFAEWVDGVPYAVVEAAFLDLGKAFENFFRRIKQGVPKGEAGHPKLQRQANRFCVKSLRVREDRVYITLLGWVRLKERGYIPTEGKRGNYATLSERAGRWYISVLVEVDNTTIESSLPGGVIGVDFGIKTLATLSNGDTFENPHPLRQAQRKIDRLNREKDRRKRGGKNWHKTKLKLQKAHAKAARIRAHAQHNLSYYLTEVLRPQCIVLENLNVKGMLSNHNLAQAIMDVGFSELRRQIEYKAECLGIDVILADTWFPSSKTCSRCGCIKDDLTLSDRVYICEHCGLEIDRDLNAARNLAALGEPRNTRELPAELGCTKALL